MQQATLQRSHKELQHAKKMRDSYIKYCQAAQNNGNQTTRRLSFCQYFVNIEYTHSDNLT